MLLDVCQTNPASRCDFGSFRWDRVGPACPSMTVMKKSFAVWFRLNASLSASSMNMFCLSLRIQICPKKGISPTSIVLFWGWDGDHQSYSREGSGFLGYVCCFRDCLFQVRIPPQTHGSVENRAPLKLEILVSFRTGTQNWQIVEG